MSMSYIPILEIVLGILGFGLSILFCTTFCKVCGHIREEQIEREARRRIEHDGHPPPIYFIPFHGSMSQQDSEDHLRGSRYSQDVPPRYSTTAYCGAPPPYDELGFKPEDLPPAYTEFNTPVPPVTPPPHMDMVPIQTQPQ